MLDTAYKWAVESDDIELAKLGLALLGLLNIENDEKCRKVILTLGMCDEFTLYTLVAISGWVDGKKLIFDLAKQAHGWGKIHAVERLTPETQEENDWMLKFGCANGVVDAYLGLTCAEKGDMISALRLDEMSSELFEGISIIIEALLDEGPTAGTSAYEYANEALTLYLRHAEKLCITVASLSTVLHVRDFFEKQKESKTIVEQCVKIINKNVWKRLAVEAINSGDKIKFFPAWSVSVKQGFDIDEPLFRYLEKFPLENGYYVSTLLRNAEYKNNAIELYEGALPLDKIASGMGKLMGLGKEYEAHRCLAFIMKASQPYPLLGIKFVMTGLSSPLRLLTTGTGLVLCWKRGRLLLTGLFLNLHLQ